MKTTATLFFALFACANAQYMSTWGTSSGYSNQMQMPYGHMSGGHMPYHHWRDAGSEGINTKTEAIVPFQIMRSRMPNRMDLQDYSIMNVNAGEHEEGMDHLIYRQTIGEMKRPVMGVLSLLTGPMGMTNTKSISGYQDSLADDLMTCIGMDEPKKVHATEPRIIVSRGMPYYMQTMHKIKA